jgi:hypothetical protein
MGQDENNLVWILDINGARVVFAGAWNRVGPKAEADAALVRQVMESLQIRG